MEIEFNNYRCFVCGITCDNFISMQEHIQHSHEEGRDYLKCPLQRCQALIRDVRSHFKAKHPKEKLPHNCQMKVLVWRDFKEKRKKVPRFEEGFFPSKKNNCNIRYRSGWEKTVYNCLESLDIVVGYKAEPFRIDYFLNGKARKYIPDILVAFVDGSYELWEVKPNNQKQYAINQAKWKACENYCLARGYLFRVISEKNIEGLRNRVILEYNLKNEKRH